MVAVELAGAPFLRASEDFVRGLTRLCNVTDAPISPGALRNI